MEIYKIIFCYCENLNKYIYKNKMLNNHKLIIKIVCFIFKSLIEINLIILYLDSLKRKTQNTYENPNLLKFNIFYNETNLNLNNDHYEYLNIYDINYLYRFKYNIIKIEYKIEFFDKNNNLILPSDLISNDNIRLICYINILYNNQIINSLPNIYLNNYYKCIEFFNINEKVKIGIKLYEIYENKRSVEKFNFNLLDIILFNTKNLFYKNDYFFDPLIVNKKYKNSINQIYNKDINDTLRLKNSYMRYPFTLYKRNLIINKNLWKYVNIYNNYFCFCLGLYCFETEIDQKSKYYFYQTIIDNNRNIYNKTDFLFIDFIFTELSSDDAYPIFKEMANKNFPVHYLTENIDIYNEFCFHKDKCNTVILVNKENYKINGDFLERYLTLFLKLKQVISGGGTYFDYISNNLFYNIEYITYISVTHGVCYFKYFLYYEKNCYGIKRIDKLLIPPLDILISLAKKYGWKDENIISMNLPKWDKYNIIYKNPSSDIYGKYEDRYILLLFTWRDINKNKKISNSYFKNIKLLLNNKILNKALEQNNITLYYTFHHKIINYNFYNLSTKEKKFIKPINIKNISIYLNKTSLVITDFSSIVFDLIYRRKPFVIYIPDSKDESNIDNYKYNYYELIELLKNDTIKFYNKFIELNEAINKIIYYIENNFQLEPRMVNFYDKLGFKYENNVNKFISYLQNLN